VPARAAAERGTMRVLVAEDDRGLREVLARGLRENGYVVDTAPDGQAALSFLRAYEYEVAILDWLMPSRSGLEVLQHMRRTGSQTAVLMLTARDTPADRVTGLDQGADDYLVKPFGFAELLARLRALQRRPRALQQPQLVVGDLVLDPATREIRIGTQRPALTVTERGILEMLMRRSPAVVERRSIAMHVWDNEADALGSNTIDVHLARLRSKLAGAMVRIETVRGVGYRIVGG
jgi:DNA-binding response OmpR family regulator